MRGSSLKFGVRSAHFTSSHASSSCAHVVCLILRDFSPFLFLLSIFSLIVLFSSWPSASSSTMWWTNSLCTSANEDLGTLAEYDPLTMFGGRPLNSTTPRVRKMGLTRQFCANTTDSWSNEEHTRAGMLYKLATAQIYDGPRVCEHNAAKAAQTACVLCGSPDGTMFHRVCDCLWLPSSVIWRRHSVWWRRRERWRTPVQFSGSVVSRHLAGTLSCLSQRIHSLRVLVH